MTEQESWFDRNVFRFGKSPTPYERQPFQVEDGKPISGRIEIYTGHGLQRVGNGKEVWNHYPEIRPYYQIASEIAGFDVAQLSFEGPEEDLNRTEYNQVVNGTNDVVFKRVMTLQRPNLYGRYPKVAAGQSAGAADAAYELGCFGNPNYRSSFEKFIRYKSERGKIFQTVADKVNGKLLVVTIPKPKDGQITQSQLLSMNEIGELIDQYGLSLALDVAPSQAIYGGKIDDIHQFMEMVAANYGENGIKTAISKASSGPFHTSLMTDADQPARELVEEMELEDPHGYYVKNTSKGFAVTGEEVTEDLAHLTLQPVRGRDMDAQINEYCRGIMYFIGGKRTIAEDMFPESAEQDRKQIVTRRNIALTAGAGVTLGALGVGVILGTKAIKNRNGRRNE